MEHKTKPQAKHMGRKIGRMREMLSIKQDAVADKLGVSQQTVSKIEHRLHSYISYPSSPSLLNVLVL